MNAPLLPALPGYDNPQLIAHGTTALVFRAIQTNLNRPVAIKVITIDTGSVPVNAARELATTVALSSQPHIVSIIDTGMTEDDRPYIVMEYCEGGSYAQILRQKGPLPVDEVLEVGVKIGEALHAAHQVGIVHRDVKPSNILRSRFGPALTDFGIARAPDELGSTLTREMMTPHHASPEALLHQAQSGPSDIYSLASTMWTLLVGHPPFVDPAQPVTDLYLFRDRVLHDQLPAMSREDVPAWLITALTKAMSKLPSQRHGTAFEFADSLRRGALGLAPAPTATPTPTAAGMPEPTARPAAIVSPLFGRQQIHVPGVPSQAWPVPETPPMPPPPPAAPIFEPSPPPPPVREEPSPLFAQAPPPVFTEPPVRPVPAPEPRAAPPPSLAPPPLLVPTPTPPSSSSSSSSSPAAPPPPPWPAAQAPRADSPVRETPVPAPEVRRAPLPRTRPGEAAGHTLGDARTPRTEPRSDEGGWLGPAQPERWSNEDDQWPTEDRTAASFPGTRRFGERDLVAPTDGRRGGLVAVLVGVAVIAVASASLLVLRSRTNTDVETDPPLVTAPASTTFISAQTRGAPTDVKIAEDRGTLVRLTWTDPTAGVVSFVVVQKGPTGEEPLTQAAVPGTKSVTFDKLSPSRNYCYQVGAVYAVDYIALAPEVCTRR